jgi:class 3 adenylate cyclase
LTYQELWRRAVANYLLGTLISVVPAFAFYSLAFDYSPDQWRLLARLILPGGAAFVAVDLAVLAWLLRPVRHALALASPVDDRRRGAERLRALPVWVLPRIFGPHAVSATLVFNLLVVWANNAWGLGVPESHFPLYWLLNLTVVPVGHVVYEYHATERLIRRPLAQLRARGLPPAEAKVLLPLGTRIFLFSFLLGMAPLVIAVFILVQRGRLAGLEFAASFYAQLAALAAALTLLWLLLLGLVSRELREQTRSITSALDRIAGGDLHTEVPVESTSEFGRIALAVDHMAAGLRERQQLRDLFGAYLTRELAEQLISAKDLCATERRAVTVLFLDLRDFTALSTRHPAETVVGLLNRFLAVAAAAIAQEGGHVNKYLGDGLLAVFGAPVALADSPARAVRAALEVRRRLEGLNQKLEAQGLPRLRMGAGVHTGEAIVGTIGSPEHKLEYTVIGEPVNLASRLEGLNKQFGTEILMSAEAAARVKDSIPLRSLGPTEVRGVPRPVEVFTTRD